MSDVSIQEARESQGHQDHPNKGPMVQIKVNDNPVTIHRGHQTVAAIKQAAGVPLADDLEQIVDGQLKLLPDDGAVVLKGGEEFIAHIKTGGSSHS